MNHTIIANKACSLQAFFFDQIPAIIAQPYQRACRSTTLIIKIRQINFQLDITHGISSKATYP